MFTGKNVKKFVIVFLIISLIYANLSTTILGVISYAQENTEVTKPKREEENKPFKVEISDFTKNEMSEKETEYQEKITLTPNKEKSFEKVTISDIETFIGKEIIDNEEENVNNINTFYRATKIDKLQLLDAMGIDGKLNLYYEILETENISDETENVEKSSENREENRKTIEESNCIEQENYQTKAKINMLREKNRLYDKLQMQTAGQIELLNNLLYQYEAETNLTAKRRLLAKISVIGTYIKRCGNLIFIEERAEVSDIAELEACLEESFSSLRLMGVMCAFAAPSGAFIYVRDAVRIYNFFETVIEACLDSLLSVWVKFRVHKESLIFCMEVESNANLTSFFEITDTSSYEDGVWRFTFTVKKAGEA